MELSDTPRDEVLAGSHIGRRLTHATRSRKRSEASDCEGDELSLSDAVGAAPIICAPAMRHAPQRSKGVTRLRRIRGLILYGLDNLIT